MRKLARLLKYLKAVCLIGLFALPAAAARSFIPRYKDIWLVSERGNEARDNGYHFFKYLRKFHPEIHSVFVITRSSPDYDKVSSLGETVEFGSLKHYFLYSCAEKLISTHMQPASPDLVLFGNLARHGIMVHGSQVFLQHGIIKDNLNWLHYPNSRTDLFVCGAKKEYDYVKSVFHHPEGVVQYLGLCRYDRLAAAEKPKRQVLVMPTWRGSRYPSGNAFPETQFYRYFQSFLMSKELADFLEAEDLKLIFYPHIELQRELHHFHTDSRRIVLADAARYDVQELLM